MAGLGASTAGALHSPWLAEGLQAGLPAGRAGVHTHPRPLRPQGGLWRSRLARAQPALQQSPVYPVLNKHQEADKGRGLISRAHPVLLLAAAISTARSAVALRPDLQQVQGQLGGGPSSQGGVLATVQLPGTLAGASVPLCRAP